MTGAALAARDVRDMEVWCVWAFLNSCCCSTHARTRDAATHHTVPTANTNVPGVALGPGPKSTCDGIRWRADRYTELLRLGCHRVG